MPRISGPQQPSANAVEIPCEFSTALNGLA